MNNLTESIEENRPEEKTEFSLILLQIGPKKIEVIKAVRRFVSLGLSEAKNLVESSRPTILGGVSKEVVENARISLESVGATVEIV